MYRMIITVPGAPERNEVFRTTPEAWEWLRNEFRDDWDHALGTAYSALYSEGYRHLSEQDINGEARYTIGDRIYQIARIEGASPKPRPPHHNQRRRARLVEDIDHLLESTRPDQIAARLGYADAESVRTALLRLGRPDLASRFARSNWDPMTEDNRNHKATPHTAVRNQ